MYILVLKSPAAGLRLPAVNSVTRFITLLTSDTDVNIYSVRIEDILMFKSAPRSACSDMDENLL